MKTSQVSKLSTINRFLYWIEERHKIHLKRENGDSKPWTDDKVLQSNFFTNPYRENDKTTVWFRENVRDPLRDDPRVLLATVIFRWFNRIDTGELLLEKGLLTKWNAKSAVPLLRQHNKTGPVFTGAYMIKAGNGPPGCKIPNVCEAITTVWKSRKKLLRVCDNDCRLEALWNCLIKFPHLGGFMSYEIVCDLRYTDLLSNAPDIDTWTNLGPGACRGIRRLANKPIIVPRTGMKDARPKPDKNWMEKMSNLLELVRTKLPNMPKFGMREIEHSLCEFDKYERVRLKQGRSKRKYQGS